MSDYYRLEAHDLHDNVIGIFLHISHLENAIFEKVKFLFMSKDINDCLMVK